MSILEQFQLSGRSALVTGAACGLGKAMALALAEAGAKVAVVDIDGEAGPAVAAEIEAAGGGAIFVHTDVSDVVQVKAMVERTVESFGKLDIAVNNAGVVGPLFVPVTDITPEQWRRTMAVNLDGVFFCAQAEGSQMIAQGQGGRIINIASMSASVANAGPAYCSCKAGVVMITKALAVEWAKYGITVNSISPGTIVTPMSMLFLKDEAVRSDMEAKIPLGRIGDPGDMAGLVVYLASGASGYFTGHDFIMDGGYTVV